ncbi:MAG: CHAT domain-containing protein [Steroidobacteraceae bacterium]|nr:CHAT domain-containing protein [Steroidobacteraceae bacterium]
MVLASLTLSAALDSAVAGARSLNPGDAVAYRVDAHHPAEFSVTVPAGDTVQVRIEQTRHFTLLDLRAPGDAAPERRFCDSGKGGLIRATLVAASLGRYRLTLDAYDLHQTATGWIRVSTVRASTAVDHERATAEQYLARAEWARHRGAPATWAGALAGYREAQRLARRIGDARLLRAALIGEARLDVFDRGDYAAAAPLARTAVTLPDRGDRPGEALAWKTLSSVDAYQARYPSAIKAARQALRLYRRTGDRYWQDVVLGNLAYIEYETGRTGLALRTAHQSLTIAREIGDAFGVDFDLEAIAEFHRARGEFDQAFADFRRALDALRRQPYPAREAAVWNGLGELYLSLDEPADSRAALAKAVRFADAAHDAATQLEVLVNLADASRDGGDAHAALASDLEGLNRATALGLPREQTFLLLGLGRDYASLGERRRARAAYRRAISLAEKIGQFDSEAAAWLALGDLQAGEQHLPAARADYRRALALWRPQSARLDMASAEGSLARLDWRRQALNRARLHIQRAVNLIGSVRSTLAAKQLRTAYFASEHAYYDLGVSILMELRQAHPGAGFAHAALRLVERARARTLLDAVADAAHVSSTLLPASLARSMRRTDTELDAAYADSRDLLQDPTATPARVASVHRRIEALQNKQDRLEALARSSSRRYAALADARPMPLRQLQRHLLGDHDAVLEYWIGAQRGYAWLIRHRRITTLPLAGAKVLAPEVRAFREALTARSRTLPGENLQRRNARIAAADERAANLAARLGAQLLPTRRRLRGIETLYVVPDGPLFGIPFAALRPAGDPKPLLESTAVTEEPSAAVMASLAADPMQNRAPPNRRATSIAVFADPVYDRDDPRLAARMPTTNPRVASLRWAPNARLSHLARLPASAREARAISTLSGDTATVHLGFGATVKAVRRTPWRRFAVAHFAVHTLLDAAHPEFSGLVLTRFHRDGAPEPDVLWLRDIYALDMPVDLVVLSSCHTLGGRDVPGEGLVGLYRAFLMAGAHAVLGTLWSVQDRATARLMRSFYADLLPGRLAPAQALQKAQKTFLRSARYAAPYYWAAFSIEGMGEPLR